VVGLAQHPDEHCPKHPILLAVDQEFGEGPALRVAPERADPLGPLKVGEHEDVEQFGAGNGTGVVEPLAGDDPRGSRSRDLSLAPVPASSRFAATAYSVTARTRARGCRALGVP
jgi:hypothetical protein